MCKEMEKMRDKARKEGREEGMVTAKKEMVLNLYKMGMAEELIAKAAQESVDLVRKWIGLVAVK